MRTALLRERVEIQAATQSRDAGGGVVETWSGITSHWASVRALRSEELARAATVESVATHEVIMRYWSELKQVHRLLWRGRVLHIEQMSADAKRTQWTLQCREVTE